MRREFKEALLVSVRLTADGPARSTALANILFCMGGEVASRTFVERVSVVIVTENGKRYSAGQKANAINTPLSVTSSTIGPCCGNIVVSPMPIAFLMTVWQ